MIRDSLGEEKSNMYIERGKKSIALLKEILAIPSVNGADNEGAVAEFIANYLKEKHIDAFVQQIDETHANIIAKLEGKSSETVVWNGHLDTVPYGSTEEWNTDPSIPVEKNGRIYARGASDMKSGLAAMVYLLGEIGESGEKPEQTILFLGTCDEEKSGLGAEKY